MRSVELRKNQINMGLSIIGLVTYIVMSGIIGTTGIAYVAIGAETAALFAALATGGIADGLGRQMRMRLNRHCRESACKVYAAARPWCIIWGVAFMLLILCAGAWVTNRLGLSDLLYPLLICSPLILLSCVTALLSAFYQGTGNFIPTVVESLLMQVIGLVMSLVLGRAAYTYGQDVAALLHADKFANLYGAMGMCLGLVIAALISLVVLTVIYIINHNSTLRAFDDSGARESPKSIARAVSGTIPESIVVSLSRFPAIGCFVALVIAGRKMGAPLPLEDYGAVVGRMLPIIGIGATLTAMVGMGPAHKAVSAARKKDIVHGRQFMSLGLQSLSCLGVLISMLVIVLAAQIAKGMFGVDADGFLVHALRAGGMLVLVWPLGSYFSRILGAGGRRGVQLIVNMVCCVILVIAVICLYPRIGSCMAVVYGLDIYAALQAIVCAILARFLADCDPEWPRVMLLPVVIAAVLGIVLFFAGKGLAALTGPWVSIAIVGILGSILYSVLLLVTRAINGREIEMLPAGRLLAALGRFFRVSID